jgi:hypothetical protein
MLDEDTPELPHLSARKWLRNTDYPDLDFQASLDVFAEQRMDFLAKLKSLPFDDWQRDAVINDRTHTVFSHARRMALQEQGHWEQFETAVKVQG